MSEEITYAEHYIGECTAGTCDRPASVRMYGQTSSENTRRIGGVTLAGKLAPKRVSVAYKRHRYRVRKCEAACSFCQAYSTPVPDYS